MRAWQNINLLNSLGPVHVLSVGIREEKAPMPIVASWIHIDSKDFPVRASGISSQLLRLLRPREFPVENDYAAAHINQHLHDLLDRVNPEIIVISHWNTALPTALRNKHVLIADTHNVESTLARDIWLSSGKRPNLRQRYRFWQLRRRELSLLRRVDWIWASSDTDARAFAKMDRRLKNISVWPNAVDVASYASIAASRTPRALPRDTPVTIGYIGFYGYKPNADAARVLIEDVFPRILAAYPLAQLLLVGKGPTEHMLRTAREQTNVVVTGPVDDVRAYLPKLDLLLVPLSAGSGTRLKILEAFAAKIPVVSTAKGAEGLSVQTGQHIEICSLEEMAQRGIALLDDQERRARQVVAAYEVVQASYSWDALAQRLPAMLR